MLCFNGSIHDYFFINFIYTLECIMYVTVAEINSSEASSLATTRNLFCAELCVNKVPTFPEYLDLIAHLNVKMSYFKL